ncbi:MAG: hypothetical protein ABGW81_11065 [Paracoccaceae bacterium]
MLTLSTYYKAYGEPSASPFGIKAIFLLQLSGLEWKLKYNNDPGKTPKGKMPVLPIMAGYSSTVTRSAPILKGSTVLISMRAWTISSRPFRVLSSEW